MLQNCKTEVIQQFFLDVMNTANYQTDLCKPLGEVLDIKTDCVIKRYMYKKHIETCKSDLCCFGLTYFYVNPIGNLTRNLKKMKRNLLNGYRNSIWRP